METKNVVDDRLNDVDYVRFTYSDIHGIARGKTVPSRHAPMFINTGVTTYVGKSHVLSCICRIEETCIYILYIF